MFEVLEGACELLGGNSATDLSLLKDLVSLHWNQTSQRPTEQCDDRLIVVKFIERPPSKAYIVYTKCLPHYPTSEL